MFVDKLAFYDIMAFIWTVGYVHLETQLIIQLLRSQSYKTFYGRKLRIFVISYSVCPLQTFPG
jgi:hypothetical protein